MDSRDADIFEIDFFNIAVKSIENNDQENSWEVEQKPFLGSNTDTISEGIYWRNAQGISNKINNMF